MRRHDARGDRTPDAEHGGGNASGEGGRGRRGKAVRAAAGALMPLLLLATVLVSACSEQITKHGHLFRETDIAQVQPGMSQEQVKLILGSPTTTTTSGNGSVYYYISSTEKKVAFLKGSEVDRQVLAIYFTPAATVERVANYGMQDGKVIDFVSRTTPAPGGNEDNIIKQLFRNLGTKQIFGE